MNSKLLSVLLIACFTPGISKRASGAANKKKDLGLDQTDQTIPRFHIQPSSLTITSFLYNPSSLHSDWIDRIFGSKSVFYSKDFVGSFLKGDGVSGAEAIARFSNFSKVFKLPEYAIWPPCSIEMLGYGQIGHDSPFLHEDKSSAHTGKAVITLSNATRTESWECFYRPLFENWRNEYTFTKPHFWSVVFFCPASKGEESCEVAGAMMAGKRRQSVKVSMKLRKSVWNTAFQVNVINREAILKNLQNFRLPMAVCTVIPYTSIDVEKATANGAMMAEWVQYYTMLGFKVIMYDRDGANKAHLYNSSYMRSQGIRNQDFVYHDYTIRGLIDPAKKGLQYDNTEKFSQNHSIEVSRRTRFEAQGHDKTQTFTQCRFEAKALYGLDTVLVVDFDEFMYCPTGGQNIDSQRRFLKQLVENHKRQGFEQLMFTQRLVRTKTEANNPRDCVVEKVQQSRSIFDCFAPFEFFMGGHSYKSIHIGHTCPLTGYHQACPSHEGPRAFNCLCHNKIIRQKAWGPFKADSSDGGNCALVHLSTQPESYAEDFNTYDKKKILEAHSKTSELWTMTREKRAKAS